MSTVGQPPKGFEFGHTAKAGAPGKWIVQAEGDNKYLAQVDADNTRARVSGGGSEPTSPPPMSISRFGSSRYRAASTRPQVSCGAFRTKTTTTSSGRTRSRTTSCSTRSRTASARICRSKAKAARTARRAEVPAGQWSTLRVVANGPPVRGVLQRRQAVRGRGCDVHSGRARSASGRRLTP